MSQVRDAVLRTLCFHAAWDHAPTLPELVSGLDIGPSVKAPAFAGEGLTEEDPNAPSLSLRKQGPYSSDEVVSEIDHLLASGKIASTDGFYALANELPRLMDLIRTRDILQPRKRREARRAAKLLVHLGGVRFIALANTTSLGHSRDGGDLDFFVVTKAGTIWTTRLLSAGPLRLLGKLPTNDEKPDAVCLSYFVSDAGLDLTSHMLNGDDPYFRQWFLSLLPLYDDGIGLALWEANSVIRARHPFAKPWMVPADIAVTEPDSRLSMGGHVERLSEKFQRSWFPENIRTSIGQGTDVMVGRNVLKFHVGDRRATFRETYMAKCNIYDIQS